MRQQTVLSRSNSILTW